MTETFYDLLGVSEDASTGEIEDAYRSAIKRVHPDVSDDVDASERTKRLNKAKRVLTDDEERRRYDRLGHGSYTADGTNDTGEPGSNAGGSPGNRSAAAGRSDAGTTRDSTAGSNGNGGKTGRADTGPSSPGDGDSRNRRRARGQRSRRDRWKRQSNAGVEAGQETGRKNEQSQSRTGGDQYRGGVSSPGSTGGDTGSGDGVGRSRAAGNERQSTDRTGPSRASQGPSWQTSRGSARATRARKAPGASASTRRQASAGRTDGTAGDWSWNAWEHARSWAVRQGSQERTGLGPRILIPDEQSFLLAATSFFLYPFFIASILFPAFPIIARVAIGICTLLMFAYLISVPEIAIVVFGLWSLVIPVAFFVIPEVSVFSFSGVIGLSVTWLPFGLSILTLSVLRT